MRTLLYIVHNVPTYGHSCLLRRKNASLRRGLPLWILGAMASIATIRGGLLSPCCLLLLSVWSYFRLLDS